ncbi:MAG: amylo-alpha-1,6-glucosidase, partial [Rikenella sp.]|nr:amylo-alpha-1,6-glucosidase [Rikenella sp.]
YRDGVGEFRGGERYIRMADNGLIWAEMPGRALTWMNTMNDGRPVTQRPGFAVEVNALWYNAVCYALEVAREGGDAAFVREWDELPGRIRDNFRATFWLEQNPQQPYLADYVYHDGEKNAEIRPNMLLACSLPYSPLNEYERQKVFTVVEAYLLTPRGIRTLSPNSPWYQGICRGNEACRNLARHQGTVFAWLLEHYVRAGFALYGKGFLMQARELLGGFEEDLLNYGIGSVPEAYDGDAPHEACGAISYAPSVAALLMIQRMIRETEKL